MAAAVSTLNSQIEDPPEAILSIDSDGYIIDANREALSILNFQRFQLLGKKLLDISTPEFSSEAENDQSQIGKGKGKEARGIIFLSPQGKKIALKLTPIKIQNQPNDIIQYQLDDPENTAISLQKNSHNANSSPNSCAINKINDLQMLIDNLVLSKLSSSLIHDIRNPLAVILGFTELLNESRIKDPEQKLSSENVSKNLSKLSKAALKIESSINQFQKICRYQDNIQEPIVLEKTIQQACSIFSQQLSNANIILSVSSEVKNATVVADPVIIIKAIVILGLRSKDAIQRKFSTKGGHISVDTYTKNGHLILDYKDSAKNLDVEKLQKATAQIKENAKDKPTLDRENNPLNQTKIPTLDFLTFENLEYLTLSNAIMLFESQNAHLKTITDSSISFEFKLL